MPKLVKLIISVENGVLKKTWLAKEIFTAFPEEVTGLKLDTAGCERIYFQRIFPDGDLDEEAGIYRHADDGLYDVCMDLEKDWEDMVI
jgi:hypothetical protein